MKSARARVRKRIKWREGVKFCHGAFAQFYHFDRAAYEAPHAYRTHNPINPVHLISDGGDHLEELASEFGCHYVYDRVNNGTARNRHDNTNQYLWLRRIQQACVTSLAKVDWIVLLEPDVECRKAPTILPEFALCGPSPGPPWRETLKTLFHSIFGDLSALQHIGHYYTGCGGSIFNRQAFLECLSATPREVFEIVSKYDNRILSAEDATLSFLFQINGYETGGWGEFSRWGQEEGNARAFVHGNKQHYGKPSAAFLRGALRELQ